MVAILLFSVGSGGGGAVGGGEELLGGAEGAETGREYR